jgi:flagellar hook assembly protein FlgD
VKAVHLFQNQPNPFSPETSIAFNLPMAGPVELVIYGVNGRRIRGLVKDTREVGRHTASWDGRDDAGEKVSSGIYFYQLTAAGAAESRRMILLP